MPGFIPTSHTEGRSTRSASTRKKPHFYVTRPGKRKQKIPTPVSSGGFKS